MPLKGYVLRDGAGILGMVPDFQGSEAANSSAWKYIKENKVLKVLYASSDEDIIDFVIRVQKEADIYRKTHGTN